MTRLSRCILPILALILAFAVPLRADEVPYLAGHVNDLAHLLSPATVQALETRLTEYETKTGNQFAVLIISALGDQSIEEYSLRVAETWKLGKKGVDNGAILVISKEDRKLRIEVGYGLESSLTDALCNYIIREKIVPAFKSGDFDAGITEGVESMIQAADGALQVTETSGDDSGGMIALFVILLVISLIALPVSLFAGRVGGWVVMAIAMFFPSLVVIFEPTGWRFLFLALVIGWITAFLLLRRWTRNSTAGQKWLESARKGGTRSGSRSSGWSGSGWSGWSGSGWSSGWSSRSSSSGWSSGSSFSGGGGSFGGGGYSGSW